MNKKITILKDDNFLEAFKSPNKSESTKYLLQFGKKPKPISPIIFEKENKNEKEYGRKEK